MDPLFVTKSEILNQCFGLKSTLRSLGKILPCVLRGAIHHFTEGTPEVVDLVCLASRSRHIHSRTLEVLRNGVLLLSLNLSFKLCTSFLFLTDSSLISSFSRIRTFRTEELVYVISQDIGVSQHQVHYCTLFASGTKNINHGIVALNLFD